MKKSLLVFAALAFAAFVSYSAGIDPLVAGSVLMAVGPVAVPQDMATAFNTLFQPKPQFPQWFQPHPEIGQLLCHSQEEIDDYASRDWSPKPLPGSEGPPKKLDTEAQIAQAKAELDAQMAKFAEQQKTFFAMVEQKMASLPKAAAHALAEAQTDMAAATAEPAAEAVPASGSDGAADAVVGTLSDSASSEAPEKPAKGKK